MEVILFVTTSKGYPSFQCVAKIEGLLFRFSGGNLTDIANDVIAEPNGKILIAGVAGYSATRSYAAVARLLPDGTLDTSFSSDGKDMHAPTPDKINRYNAIARRADGKYIAVGETGDKDGLNGTGSRSLA